MAHRLPSRIASPSSPVIGKLSRRGISTGGVVIEQYVVAAPGFRRSIPPPNLGGGCGFMEPVCGKRGSTRVVRRVLFAFRGPLVFKPFLLSFLFFFCCIVETVAQSFLTVFVLLSLHIHIAKVIPTSPPILVACKFPAFSRLAFVNERA